MGGELPTNLWRVGLAHGSTTRFDHPSTTVFSTVVYRFSSSLVEVTHPLTLAWYFPLFLLFFMASRSPRFINKQPRATNHRNINELSGFSAMEIRLEMNPNRAGTALIMPRGLQVAETTIASTLIRNDLRHAISAAS